MSAAIAQWIRPCLPSCRPGFESIYAFINFKNCVMRKKTKINKKRPGLAQFKIKL